MYARVAAIEDLFAIRCSDIFVLFPEPEEADGSRSFGRMVEFGYALALNTPCCVIGSSPNIFCTPVSNADSDVRYFETFDDFVVWLTGDDE
jgi:hypothetical protein